KITRPDASNDVATFHVEGRLTRETTAELRAACGDPLDGGQPVVLHLGGVAFCDPAGVELLHELRKRGCVLVGCSDFTTAILDGGPASRERLATRGSNDEEGALLRALRAGDASAFEHLVRRQTSHLFAAARRIVGNDEDARDVVQEAFVSAYRSLDRFGGDSRISTWLHRIAVNAALMKLRSRRRRPEEPIEHLLPCFDENGAWAAGMASVTSGAETHVASNETRDLVRRCIARLPDRYREVLVLRDIEDFDTSEVADTLGITANAVKIRLHRARQALRTLIEEERGVPGAVARATLTDRARSTPAREAATA